MGSWLKIVSGSKGEEDRMVFLNFFKGLPMALPFIARDITRGG